VRQLYADIRPGFSADALAAGLPLDPRAHAPL
jgi:hypothetical protein